MMKALIIGISGQDGTLLCRRLEALGHEVLGFSRSSVYASSGRTPSRVPDLLDHWSLERTIAAFMPDQIYYLAAHHTSSEKADPLSPRQSFLRAQEVHVTGLLNCLCAMEDHAPDCRLFYASSSLVFSGTHGEVQDETTPLSPAGAYGITKAQAMWLCREFRETRGSFASVGILYNHESHLRPAHFLSQKIIRAAIRASRGDRTGLVLGGLEARVDWSYAPDVTDAMHRILDLDTPGTFIVARGEAHTVREFADLAYGYFDLDWKDYVTEDPSLLARQAATRIGNPEALFKKTGWGPSLSFAGMVRQLTEDTLAAGILSHDNEAASL